LKHAKKKEKRKKSPKNRKKETKKQKIDALLMKFEKGWWRQGTGCSSGDSLTVDDSASHVFSLSTPMMI